MTTSPTDSILARTMSVRPDNKIAMRCPSWPDSPLHKYFGMSQSTRRDRGFVFSSLGYLRLYQSCCCTPEASMEPARPEAGFQSSFVHLEERLRSDGPFILYQRPPERKMFGLGLTERAREKKLLKYYKYFQGFQRKLQVSRQFEQQSVKQTNKVQKIINCYKRAKVTESSSAAIRIKRHSLSGAKSDGIRMSPDERISLKQGSRKLMERDQTEEKEYESDRNGGEEFIYRSSQDLTEEWMAYLASIDVNANKFQRRLTRGTAMAPSLETIVETSGEGDVIASENSSVTAAPKILSQSAAKKTNVSSEKSSRVVAKITIPENTANISNQPTPRTKSSDRTSLNAKRCKTADEFSAKTGGQEVNIQQFIDGENRSWGSPLRGNSASRALFENIGLVPTLRRQLETFSSASVRGRASQKKSRRRHSLMRSRRSTSNHSNVRVDAEEEADAEEEEKEKEEELEEEKEDEKSVDEEEELPTQKKKSSSRVPRSGQSSRNRSNDSKQRSGRSRAELAQKKKVKFTGWDLNATLGSRTFKTFPNEQDLLGQMLQRVEKLNAGAQPGTDLPKTKLTEQRVCADQENTKEYLERQAIVQRFQNFTNALVLEQSDQPLKQLEQRSRELSQRYSQGVQIEEDLNQPTDLNEFPPKSRTSCANLRFGSHFRQAKPKFRVNSSAHVTPDRQLSRTYSVCDKLSIDLKPLIESTSAEPVEKSSCEKQAEETRDSVQQVEKIEITGGMQTEELESQEWFEEQSVDGREPIEETEGDPLEEGSKQNTKSETTE